MTNSLSEQLRNSADDAIAMTVEKQCRLHPEVLERFGERGLKAWRTDIRHHIDYLCAAVDSGRDQPFADYLCWVAEVLKSRGVDAQHLNHSLDDLAGFYRERLTGADQARVLGLLATGRQALVKPATLPAEFRHLPPALPQKDAYLDLLLASQRVAAHQLVSECMTAGASLATVNVRIIQAAMYDVGRMWQANRISVAQEHLATAISQYVMANAFSLAEFAEPMARTAIFANVENNHHALGLRMISDAFETAGWTAQFLGANVPDPSLIGQVDALRPDLLGLSVSMPQQLKTTREFIGSLRAEMGQACPPILLGGRTINALDEVWRDLGADLWVADAEQAELLAKNFGADANGRAR
ncbi:MAG: cobalamin-dependent protein [Rhodocyclales bacterium]|nr:cobalamin-dependent protein [Rhodocyclales bacterium]